jgi:hypothetical protein
MRVNGKGLFVIEALRAGAAWVKCSWVLSVVLGLKIPVSTIIEMPVCATVYGRINEYTYYISINMQVLEIKFQLLGY